MGEITTQLDHAIELRYNQPNNSAGSFNQPIGFIFHHLIVIASA